MSAPKEPYELHPGFEELVVYYCATNTQFWSRVGHAVEPERLRHPLGKLVFDTARLIAKDTGKGPDAGLITVQRLAARMYEGKVTQGELTAVNDLIDRVCDMPPPKVEDVIEELLPIVRRALHRLGIMMATDDYAKKGDFRLVESIFEKARRLGEVELVDGSRLAPVSFDEIAKLKLADRLPTGVIELDLQLGGLRVGELGVWIGDSGGGKSQALAHQAAESIRNGHLTGFITLELPKPVQLARLFANITGMPVNQILDNEQDREEARRRMGLAEPLLGICEVADMPPQATTVRDIVEWITAKEQEHQTKMRAIIIDYADKLHDPKVRDNDYVGMRNVYEALRRDIAVAREMWVWTASQATRPNKDRKKKLDLHHVADSMHKVRVADLIITLNPTEDMTQTEFFIAKNRMGKSRFNVGPVLTDFERARLVPAARELLAW